MLTLRAACENGAVLVQRLERWPALARELEITTAAATLLDTVCARLQATPAALSAFALTAGGLVAAPGEQPALWGDPQAARQKRLVSGAAGTGAAARHNGLPPLAGRSAGRRRLERGGRHRMTRRLRPPVPLTVTCDESGAPRTVHHAGRTLTVTHVAASWLQRPRWWRGDAGAAAPETRHYRLVLNGRLIFDVTTTRCLVHGRFLD